MGRSGESLRRSAFPCTCKLRSGRLIRKDFHIVSVEKASLEELAPVSLGSAWVACLSTPPSFSRGGWLADVASFCFGPWSPQGRAAIHLLLHDPQVSTRHRWRRLAVAFHQGLATTHQAFPSVSRSTKTLSATDREPPQSPPTNPTRPPSVLILLHSFGTGAKLSPGLAPCVR